MTDDNGNGKVEAARQGVRLDNAIARIEDAAERIEGVCAEVNALKVEVAKIKERQGMWAAGQALLTLIVGAVAATLKQP